MNEAVLCCVWVVFTCGVCSTTEFRIRRNSRVPPPRLLNTTPSQPFTSPNNTAIMAIKGNLDLTRTPPTLPRNGVCVRYASVHVRVRLSIFITGTHELHTQTNKQKKDTKKCKYSIARTGVKGCYCKKQRCITRFPHLFVHMDCFFALSPVLSNSWRVEVIPLLLLLTA